MPKTKVSDGLEASAIKPRYRYTVELPTGLEDKVTILAEEHGLSKSDVIRDAVRLLAEYDQLRREGYSTGGWKSGPEGGIRELVKVKVGI